MAALIRLCRAGILLAAGLVFSSQLAAAPANPTPRLLTQPDGSIVSVTPRGDEWLSWYETLDGRVGVFNRQSRAYEFARLAVADGRYRLEPSGIRLGQKPPAFAVPMLDLMRAWKDARAAADALVGDGLGAGILSQAAPASTATASNPDVFKTLVVMVEFTDQKIVSPDATWSHKIFGGYPGPVAAGTVNDYFGEVARGRLWFAPAEESYGTPGDGIVKVSLNMAHPQLANDSYRWLPVLYQALQAADAYVDFAAFDTDRDGYVSKDELQVAFVVAGRESSWGSYQDRGLWGHAWSFPDDSQGYPLLDGVRVAKNSGRYMAVGELHGPDSGLYDSTIGIIAHELGHSALLLGDLYHAEHDVEGWGLMGNGSWGRRAGEPSGTTPVHLLGASKLMASLPSGTGLLQPTVVQPTSSPQRAHLHHAHGGDGYNLVRVDGEYGGFYVIETRKALGYDEGLTRYSVNPGDTGMLVSFYQRRNVVHVYRAGGGGAGSTSRLDFFHQGHVDRLSPDTTPSSAYPGGAYSGLVLENITAPGEIMSVDIRHQPYACREFTSTLAQHESARRAYTVSSGSLWLKKTEYYAYGTGELLGSASYASVTLKETLPGQYAKGHCPVGVDTTPPVITLLGDPLVKVGLGQYWSDPGYSASDDRDGNLTHKVIVDSNVDTSRLGRYTLRYNVRDAAGNAAVEQVRTVEVVAQAPCSDYAATPRGHMNAGRASACGAYNLYACAVGSGTNIGSIFSVSTVVVKEQPAGHYDLGSCPRPGS